MEAVLKRLQSETPGIEAATLTSVDGLIITSVLSKDLEEDRMAAISASFLSLGESTTNDLKRSLLEQVIVKGALGYLIISKIGNEAILTVVTNQHAKLGVVLWEMRNASEELKKFL